MASIFGSLGTTPNFNIDTSTQAIPDKTTPDITPLTMAQGITSTIGSLGLSVINKTLSGGIPLGPGITTPALDPDAVRPVVDIPDYLQPLFGSSTLSDVQTQVSQLAPKIATNPIAKKYGFSPFSVPLAAGVVVGSDLLNLDGVGGSEENAIKALVNETDPARVTNILQKMGFDEDVADKFAPDIAAAKSTKEVKDILQLATGIHGIGVINDAEQGSKNAAAVPTDEVNSHVENTDPFAALDQVKEKYPNLSEPVAQKTATRLALETNPTKVESILKGARGLNDRMGTGEVATAASEPKGTELEKAKTQLSVIQDALAGHPGKGAGKYLNWRNGELLKDADSRYMGDVGQEESNNGDLDTLAEQQKGYQALKAQEQEAKDTIRRLTSEPPQSVNEAIDARAATSNPEQPLASPEVSPRGATPEPQPSEEPQANRPDYPNAAAEKKEGASYPQDTTNKVKLGVKGTTVESRVRSAINKSESLATQIKMKGQAAYLAGKGLNADDLAKIRDGYQAGKPIDAIAAATSNPARATAFMQKMQDYYDYELAADRAAGGDTPRVQNYLPQYWNLSKPADLQRFNELAGQRGQLPYLGYRAQPKVFKTYAEGIAAGFTPMRANIREDLLAHSQASSYVISRQALKSGLKAAAPEMVSMSGSGVTKEGKPFVNSNIPGLEGISYHPTVSSLLQGFEPLKHPDFINLVKEKGAAAALEKTGIATTIDKVVAMAKAVPASAKEAGITGVLGSIYDHVTTPMKEVLWNWSGFHSVNITLSQLGASGLHPFTGIKGALQSVGSAVSERLYNATVDSYKALMIAKDADGASQSVYDWAIQSGAFEPRHLPAEGAQRFNPFGIGQRAIFDREIPVLQLNLAEQAAKKGIVADSPAGVAVGKEIRAITGEINAKTMNINPNTLRAASRAFLAPGFTYSKYKTLLDSFTKWGQENGAAGNLARSAVIGKSAIIGTAATLGTLLATGKFPALQQILMNFTFNPSTQTDLTNPKGRQLDITYPKTFLAEGASAILDPVGYGNARLNPLISDFLKLYTNKDYYGNPIVNPNVNTSRALQIAQNIGIGHLPIGAQAIINNLLGKQSKTQAAISIAGLNTRVSASDPTMVKYSGIDNADAQIKAIAPDDPDRLEKMQAIFNSIPPEDRQSLQYQELMNGISTKGVYTSAVEQKYFQVQALLQQGDTAGAAAITKAMSKRDYTTYKTIKTKLANAALFKKVTDLVTSGDTDGAKALTNAMTKEQYQSYLTYKKNNP